MPSTIVSKARSGGRWERTQRGGGVTELWNWRIDRVAPVEVYPALAEALGRVVMPLAVADPARLPTYAVICDVWEAPGEFGTMVDCYGVPERLNERSSIAALA